MQLPKILALMAPALVLLSCSSAGSEGGAATTVALTTTTAATVTTTTSTTATSTTAAPTSTTVVLTDEERVLAVFEAYMGFEFDERANGYGPSEQRIEQYTTGALKQRALETLQARKDAEAFLEGRALLRVESVTVSGDEGMVRACYQDGSTAVFADGSIASDLTDEPHIVELPLVRTDGVWLISERIAGGEVACEL